MAMKIVFQLFV